MKELKYLNKYLFKYKYILILGFIFIVISNFLALLPAQFLRESIDLITIAIKNIKNNDNNNNLSIENSLLFYLLMITLVTISKGFITFLMRQTIIVVSRKIEFDLKNEVYDHYQKFKYSFYQKTRTGEFISRISEDINHVRMYLGPALMYSINLITLIIIAIINMIKVDYYMTMFVIIPFVFLPFIIYPVSRHINMASSKTQKYIAYLSVFVQETFLGIRIIKSFAIEKNITKKFKTLIQKNIFINKKLISINALFMPMINLFIGASSLLIIYIGGQRVIEGHITAGVIAEFIIYINMITWPFVLIGWVISIIQRAESSQKRINQFLKEPKENREGMHRNLNGDIEFKNVSFYHYNKKILDDVSFKIPKGSKTAIMGNIGSGKTTIINLILKLLPIEDKKITINSFDINDISSVCIRNSIGYVPQENILFSDTIQKNICFGINDDLDEKKLEEISKQVSLMDNINSFEKRFQTMVGEKGVSLSGGQKQRVAIARTILRKHSIFIFDDCLSNLDVKTEKIIIKNINELFDNKTFIIITNRVSIAKKCDSIIIINNGKITGQGNHNHLKNNNDYYSKIVNYQ